MRRYWQTLRRNQQALGFFAGCRWTALNAANSRGFVGRRTAGVHPRFLQHPVIARMQGSSDPAVLHQLFVEHELDFVHHLREPPRTVIDLGANVGYASAYFLSLWSGACVLAVEPDPGNAAICSANLAPYGSRAKVLTGAVWPTSGGLVLSRGTFGDGREWATQVRPACPGETVDVEAWDVPSLIRLLPSQSVDLLKIDIEGSEQALFSSHTSWLDSIRNLCIELHGEECERAFHRAMQDYEYEPSVSGEYTVCMDLKPRSRSDRLLTP